MQYKDFIGQVQHRAHVADTQAAVKATRVVLESLSRRLIPDERRHIASQLPEEIGHYVDLESPLESYDLDKLYQSVSEKEGSDLPEAIHHTKAVVSVLREALSAGEDEDFLSEFPDDFAELTEKQWRE